MVERKTFVSNSITISYLEWGQGNEPLLLLHGMADHSLVWSELGNFLASDYHVIAPDLRGHGESSKPDKGYRFVDYIEDLEGLMNHLGWQSANILGHSWAGKILGIWVTQNPSRFRRLILVDPAFINRFPRWSKITFPFFYKVLPFLRAMGPFPDYETAEQMARQLKQYRGWSPLQEQVFKAGIEEKADGRWGSKFVVAARNQIFDEVMLYDGLTEKVSVPTLLIKPEKGINRSDWQLKPYRKYLENLQVVEVPSNHWCFLVEPDSFNQTVAQFLDNSI
ncbi:MAG: alpha/beta fold hydrolase [Microcystaceae cyanobacterium]